MADNKSISITRFRVNKCLPFLVVSTCYFFYIRDISSILIEYYSDITYGNCMIAAFSRSIRRASVHSGGGNTLQFHIHGFRSAILVTTAKRLIIAAGKQSHGCQRSQT